MLELKNITKHYESTTSGESSMVLDGINLSVEAGQSIAIVGPSGCGKSTLLNIIGALDTPSAGNVEIDGRNLKGLDEADIAQIRNQQIGFVFQLHHLLPQLTVMENVLVPTLADKTTNSTDAQQRAKQLLERVGLSDRAYHRPGELSGGQRQRVAVVRALINEPRLLLADEPTGSLDSNSADSIAELLVELNEADNLTLIVVTHSTKLAGRMERTFELVDGVLR